MHTARRADKDHHGECAAPRLSWGAGARAGGAGGGPHTGDGEKLVPGFLMQGGCQLCGWVGLSPGCSEHHGVTECLSAQEATQSTSRLLSPHELIVGDVSFLGNVLPAPGCKKGSNPQRGFRPHLWAEGL